jgi:hypothetical protein
MKTQLLKLFPHALFQKKAAFRAALALGAAGLLLNGTSSMGGTATYEFTEDPFWESDLVLAGNNPWPWQETGGNPGGFLAITYPVNDQYSAVVFPDIDPGRVVVGFKFEADFRIGNSTGDRAADGFSVSFARAGDPVLSDPSVQGGFAVGIAEAGTTTGIAVSFDTWAGNQLPDVADIEGIIVRVDNRTVLRHSVPVRHGACEDPTTLQTGPRDPAYWTAGGDPYDPGSWQSLCWQPFSIELTTDGKLTVTWKGEVILDEYQTDFFPSAGQLVLAGRTGGANQHTHVDNITLTTTALDPDTTPPTVPGNLRTVGDVGAGRVALAWDASTDDSGLRVAYHLERNEVRIGGLLTETEFVDFDVKPGTSNTYRVRAVDVFENVSDWTTLSATTPETIEAPGVLMGRIYDGIGGTAVAGLLDDPKWPNDYDRVRFLNGLSFGEPAFGDTFGNNFGIAISGVLTAPESGDFRFFVRSDDASQFFLNTAGAAIPNPLTEWPDAEETGCCAAFQEPDDPRTSEPITLTAGQQYGFLFIVKEGGGGDWGQVAMRREGDPTPASQLQPIRGAILTGQADPVGSSVTITQQPQSQTVVANERVTLAVEAEAASPHGIPPFYQWYRNGQLIAGATSPTYEIPAVPQADDGAVYTALVSVGGASATTAEAALTVTQDTMPPTIVSVQGSETMTELTINWSEPVTAPTASTAANYAISGGVNVTAAELVDPFTVRLTTSQKGEATGYVLTVNNVQDIAGNPVAAGTTVPFTSWGLVPERVRIALYRGIPGTAVSELVNHENYPANPDEVFYLGGMTFGEPTFGNTYGDNFGAELRAFFIPEESGTYRFFIRSDDASQLFVSPDANFLDPLADWPTAEETGCCAAFQEPDDPRTSEPITVQAGQRYALLFVVKEGGGGDWGQVAIRSEGDTTPANQLQPLRSQVYWFGPEPAVQPGEFEISDVSLSAGNIVISWEGEGVLEAADSVLGPWDPVEGATASPASVPATGAQQFFRVRR